MAQYASRASVNLHTHIFFKDKTLDETGYILFVRQNAIQVLIPKYGLEGTLFLRVNKEEKDGKVSACMSFELTSKKCSGQDLPQKNHPGFSE